MPDPKQHLFFFLMAGGNKWDYFWYGFCSSHQFWMSKGEPVDVADCRSVVSHFFFVCLAYENSRVAISRSCYRCCSRCSLLADFSLGQRLHVFFESVLLCPDQTSPSCLALETSFWFLKGKKKKTTNSFSAWTHPLPRTEVVPLIWNEMVHLKNWPLHNPWSGLTLVSDMKKRHFWAFLCINSSVFIRNRVLKNWKPLSSQNFMSVPF